jgi:hypothetical protein
MFSNNWQYCEKANKYLQFWLTLPMMAVGLVPEHCYKRPKTEENNRITDRYFLYIYIYIYIYIYTLNHYIEYTLHNELKYLHVYTHVRFYNN